MIKKKRYAEKKPLCSVSLKKWGEVLKVGAEDGEKKGGDVRWGK